MDRRPIWTLDSGMTNSTNGKETPAIVQDVVQAFDEFNGLLPGFRPAHAKGILLTGNFTPSSDALSLTRAPHISRSSTRVTVRFSDFAGIPTIPDSGPDATPNGIAIRFMLGAHVHTDIIGHSVDGFPARTAGEFVEFLRAAIASKNSTAKPLPIEGFLATHPAALEFVQTPKPVPASFAKQTFFSVSSYKFVNKDGEARYGRYRIRPDGPGEFLDALTAAKMKPDFLFDDIQERVSRGPVKMHILVQIAAPGDVTDDSTVHWPNDRPEVAFGSVELTGVAPDNAEEQRHIIFDPIPRVDGIEPSADPLLEVRAETYLFTGRRRRRAANPVAASSEAAVAG